MDELFCLYWEDPSGRVHAEVRFKDLGEVLAAWTRLTRGPASRMGMIKSVTITDTLDMIVRKWEKGKLVFPTPEEAEEMRSQR